MKAVRVHAFGEPPRLDDIDDPLPGEGERLATVRYAAVNPVDIWVTRGTAGGGTQRLPMTLGTEGVVEIDGRLRLVASGGLGVTRDGIAAERAVLAAGAGAELPDGIDLAQAAGLGIAGVTAWRLIHDIAKVAAGEVALVFGASGGVGSLLIQLLRAAGATVVAQTSSEAKAAGLRGLGAGSVIVGDAAAISPMDPAPSVIFDPLGGAATARAVQLLKPYGRIVLFGTSLAPTAEIDLRSLFRKAGNVLGYSGTIEPEARLRPAAERVVAELAAGRLRVPIDSVLPLADAATAHRRILEHDVAGKILLRPDA